MLLEREDEMGYLDELDNIIQSTDTGEDAKKDVSAKKPAGKNGCLRRPIHIREDKFGQRLSVQIDQLLLEAEQDPTPEPVLRLSGKVSNLSESATAAVPSANPLSSSASISRRHSFDSPGTPVDEEAVMNVVRRPSLTVGPTVIPRRTSVDDDATTADRPKSHLVRSAGTVAVLKRAVSKALSSAYVELPTLIILTPNRAEGYLLRKGKPAWKREFYELSGTTLERFTSKGGRSKGKSDISACTVCEGDAATNCFNLMIGNKTMELRAATEIEMQEWMNELSRHKRQATDARTMALSAGLNIEAIKEAARAAYAEQEIVNARLLKERREMVISASAAAGGMYQTRLARASSIDSTEGESSPLSTPEVVVAKTGEATTTNSATGDEVEAEAVVYPSRVRPLSPMFKLPDVLPPAPPMNKPTSAVLSTSPPKPTPVIFTAGSCNPLFSDRPRAASISFMTERQPSLVVVSESPASPVSAPAPKMAAENTDRSSPLTPSRSMPDNAPLADVPAGPPKPLTFAEALARARRAQSKLPPLELSFSTNNRDMANAINPATLAPAEPSGETKELSFFMNTPAVAPPRESTMPSPRIETSLSSSSPTSGDKTPRDKSSPRTPRKSASMLNTPPRSPRSPTSSHSFEGKGGAVVSIPPRSPRSLFFFSSKTDGNKSSKNMEASKSMSQLSPRSGSSLARSLEANQSTPAPQSPRSPTSSTNLSSPNFEKVEGGHPQLTRARASSISFTRDASGARTPITASRPHLASAASSSSSSSLTASSSSNSSGQHRIPVGHKASPVFLDILRDSSSSYEMSLTDSSEDSSARAGSPPS